MNIPVLVVGAGPAGLVTAIELARHGVTPLVVERHPATSIFPRATGVSTRSMEIFRSYGLEEAVRGGGWGIIPRQAAVGRLDDRSPVESPLGFPDEAASLAVSPTQATVSPQDHLEPLLVEQLRALGGEVRFSTEVIGLEQDADGVTVELLDRTNGGRGMERVEYVVGADGHRSTIRDLVGIPMTGPDDLGRFHSLLFRADLGEVLGERRYGLYLVGEPGPDRPPTIVVPSGADDRFVLAIPLPPGMDDAAVAAAFPPDRCLGLIRAAAGRPDLAVELLATSTFAFAAQVAARMRDERVILVGDAAHRMTPRGGRGMNTAIADGHALGWRLAWVVTGRADGALLDTYEVERAPIGRRNVELSMVPGGGGTDDGLLEDLGAVVASAAIVPEAHVPAADRPSAGSFVPSAEPGARAPHVWIEIGGERRSTLDLVGDDLVLLVAGQGSVWTGAVDAAGLAGLVRVVGIPASDFARAYGLAVDGAVLVRPDGIVAWRTAAPGVQPAEALAEAVRAVVGRSTALPIPRAA